MSDLGLRLVSLLGMAILIGAAWATSMDRRHFPKRIVAWGLGLQLALAVLLLHTTAGQGFFIGMNRVVTGLIGFTDAGSRFVFGSLLDGGFAFVLQVLPIIVFMGSLFAILYHVGLVQLVVRWMARGLSHTMGTSGAESLAAVANIFVGMTEAPLLVRPYVERMTRSELFTLMTTGMATIAGSVLVAYAKMLGEDDFSGHLVIASLLSAPAAILFAKVIRPRDRAAADPGRRRGGRRAGVGQLDRRRLPGRARRHAPGRQHRRPAPGLRRADRPRQRGARSGGRLAGRAGAHPRAHPRLGLRALRPRDGGAPRRGRRPSARSSG